MRKNLITNYGFDFDQFIADVTLAIVRVQKGYPLTRECLEQKTREELVDTVLALTSLLVAEKRKQKAQ